MKTPLFWYKKYSFVSNLLLPASMLWLILSYFKSIFTEKNFFNIPIICLGNVIAGGGGKTPLAIEICKYYKKKKIQIHVVYKTYKVNIGKEVVRVVKNGNPKNFEDEAILISNYAPTWLCKKRREGINRAIKSGAQLILLDDGFQDTSVSKNLNILVSNNLQGNGNCKIIPAGPLREPLSKAKAKSDCIFFYGSLKNFNKCFTQYNKQVFFGKVKINEKKINPLKDKKVIAFAGIAHPNNFFKLLDEYQINIIEKIYFPDHHHYERYEIEKILIKSKEMSAVPITTYKDYVKIPKDLKKNFAIIDTHIKFDNKKFFKFINKKVGLNA